MRGKPSAKQNTGHTRGVTGGEASDGVAPWQRELIAGC